MADADRKMRMEKKNADSKKSKKEKRQEMWMATKKINKQTIKEKNLSFKSLSRG